MTDSEITDKARGIARTLTYNDDGPQAQAKHMLLELAHRIDVQNIRVIENPQDYWTVANALGSSRPMTGNEVFLYKTWGVMPRCV